MRDTDRMSPAELPPEADEPAAHASEHVAPHAVPRVSAHKTMELDTVKVSDPTLNSRNAPTQRGLRPPVIPPGYNPDADAGYVVDDVSKPPTSKPWLLIAGVGVVVVILGGGLAFALSRGSAPAAAVSATNQEPAPPAAQVEADTAPPAGTPASPDSSAEATAAAAPEATAPASDSPAKPEAKAKPEAMPNPESPAPEANPPAAKPTATTKPTAKPTGKDGKPWEEWM